MFDKQKYTDFDRGDFGIFGDLIYLQDIRKLVVRGDRGIGSAADLVGKKIGLMRRSTIDFYADTFLQENELDQADIDLVDMDTFALVKAVTSGELDGIFTWEPHVSAVVEALNGNASVMTTKSGYSTAWLLVTMKDFADKNPKVPVSFLSAVMRAEEFIARNRDVAVQIQAEMTDTDPTIISRFFDAVDFDLSLGEALMTSLEGQAHWLIRNGKYDARDFPNFLEIIDLDPLRQVKPRGIGIIH